MINTWHWLIWEAALPLFGAPVLYLLFGFGKWVTTEKGKPFKWAWNQAFDPLGCLYGGAFLALHAEMKGKDAPAYAQLTNSVWVSFGSAGFCLIVLASAMFNRGDSATWKPPLSMLILTSLVIWLIVSAGFEIHDVLNSLATVE
jgi:hypothetical protein